MCGIVGILGSKEAAKEAFLGLTVLQHRGQDAAGILTYDHDGFHSVKNIGLVESVFTREGVESLTGNMALGHARYATVGRGDPHEVQPFIINYPFGLGIVHNGNVVNTAELTHELKTVARRHLLTQSDSEIILNLFAHELSKSRAALEGTKLSFEEICKAVNTIFKKTNGSYSICSMIAGEGLVAFRDPNGIRPLVWGKKDGNKHMVASETVALTFLGYEVVRHLHPGEVLFINMEGEALTATLDKRESRPCMFESVYFASPESELETGPVYRARIELGKNLGQLVEKTLKERGIKADIIVPVPETSRIAAIALSEVLKIPYREVLIKNRYIKRTFILDTQEKRQKAVSLKLSPVRSEIEGKNIVLVDDSIVRGTTSKKIIDLVKGAGAKTVTFVSTCPPIRYGCFYGIDFPSESELIAGQKSMPEIEKALGADAVIYQTEEGLLNAVGAVGAVGGGNPCMACLNGKYPTKLGDAGEQFSKARSRDRAARGP